MSVETFSRVKYFLRVKNFLRLRIIWRVNTVRIILSLFWGLITLRVIKSFPLEKIKILVLKNLVEFFLLKKLRIKIDCVEYWRKTVRPSRLASLQTSLKPSVRNGPAQFTWKFGLAQSTLSFTTLLPLIFEIPQYLYTFWLILIFMHSEYFWVFRIFEKVLVSLHSC